jgi:hypothetical protein
MIAIIHGTDTAASRSYFLNQKEQIVDAVYLAGEKITITDLTQILDGNGLFAEQKTIFIENFFHKKKNKNEFTALTEYLQKKSASHDIFLWEGKELDRSAFLLFKTAVPKQFKLPQTLFLFLDTLKPENGKQLIQLFHQTIVTTEAEMIFFMLIRQMRLLLALLETQKDNSSEVIDELKRMQPWQKQKLQKQANLFTQEQLITLYQKLFAIEWGQKTGNLSLSLIASIDFFLLTI